MRRRPTVGEREWKLVVRRALEGGAGPRWIPSSTDDAERWATYYSRWDRSLDAAVVEDDFREALARFAVEIAGRPPNGRHVVVSRETGFASAWPGGFVVGLTKHKNKATIVLDDGAGAT